MFYPGDWTEEAELLLSSLASAQPALAAQDCEVGGRGGAGLQCGVQVYAVSGDSVHCHAQWLESTGLRPAFPLLSDTGHALAARLGVPLGQEAGPRCVVITDCVGVVLEMVTSSLDTQELVGAGAGCGGWAVSSCVPRCSTRWTSWRCWWRRGDSPWTGTTGRSRRWPRCWVSAACCSAAGLGCNLCYAGGLAGQVRLGRERGLARCGLQERGRSTSGQARSISRPRYQQLPAQAGTNPLADSHHRRQVDRLVKGYF